MLLADQYLCIVIRWIWVFTHAHTRWWELQP